VLPLIGNSTCEFVCEIPIKGSNKRGKNLIIISAFLGLKYLQICTQLNDMTILVQTNPFKFSEFKGICSKFTPRKGV
jgi:hypothetical protein